jgi:hypothetical protein
MVGRCRACDRPFRRLPSAWLHARWRCPVRAQLRYIRGVPLSRHSLPLFLIFALLITLLSPHVGWEMVRSGSALDHVASGASAVLPAGHQLDDGHGHEEQHAHHVCAGHQLSHSPAQLGCSPSVPLIEADESVVAAADIAFSSHIPPGLDRPPTRLLA